MRGKESCSGEEWRVESGEIGNVKYCREYLNKKKWNK